MISRQFLRHSIETCISSILLYYAFDIDYNGWILAVTSFIIMLDIIEKTSDKKSMLLYETLFVSVFISLQYIFVIRIAFDNILSLFVIIIIMVMYLVPLLLLSNGATANNKDIIFLTSYLISEYMFSHSSIGNQMFQLGVTLGGSKYIIQFYEFTGPYMGSLWIMIVSYGLFNLLRGHLLYGLFVFVLLLSSIISGIGLYKDKNEDGKNILVSAAAVNSSSQLDSLLYSYADSSEYLILPEAIAEIQDGNVRTNPLITKLYRFAANNNINIITGLYVRDDKELYNNVYTISSSLDYVRSKEILIAFAEYFPWHFGMKLSKEITSRLPRMIHCLDNKENVYDDGKIKYSPIICYETVFSDFINKLCKEGAEVFFVSSSNSYIDSDHIEAITQKIVQMNAVLCSRYFVRSTEKGRSFIVNCNGEIIERSCYIPCILTDKIETNKTLTFYSLHYMVIDVFYYFMLMATYLIVSIYGRLKSTIKAQI